MVIRMRIIVSGAGGFLGSNIIKTALAVNIPVVAITSKPEALSGATVVPTRDFLENGYPCTCEDVFINCLFPTNADGFKMANGLDRLYRTVTMAHKSGVGAFINISSQSVYPSRRTAPAKEGDLLSLETPYAVGKYSSEVFVNQVFQNLPHTNIRMASLLGMGYDQRIVNRMVDQALRGEELKVMGGMQRYGFLDVRDAAMGILKAANNVLMQWESVYNLGPMGSTTLVEIAELIVEQLKPYGVYARLSIFDGNDFRNSSIDAQQFMRDFNWKNEISLSQTIDDIVRSKV